MRKIYSGVTVTSTPDTVLAHKTLFNKFQADKQNSHIQHTDLQHTAPSSVLSKSPFVTFIEIISSNISQYLFIDITI